MILKMDPNLKVKLNNLTKIEGKISAKQSENYLK